MTHDNTPHDQTPGEPLPGGPLPGEPLPAEQNSGDAHQGTSHATVSGSIANPATNRRGLLRTGGTLAAAGALAAVGTGATVPAAVAGPRGGHQGERGRRGPALRFGKDGRFRVVQFNDTQDGPLTDRRTIEFMDAVLEKEKPGFALINGDVIDGSPRTAREVRQAINNVVLPMERRSIPWAITFGNHDEDSIEEHHTGMTRARIVEFVRQYRYNLNPTVDPAMPGASNACLEIAASRGRGPAFALWLLDSGAYAPERPGGQDRKDLMGYDWIRPEQIRWYQDRSVALERRAGRKVPGLMYFHIPTWEHHHMWYGQQFTSEDSGHARAVDRHGIVGEKHEGVYTGMVNSGIYSAVMARGDVRGIYCGHDHINTFKGNYFGVELGYAPGTGFGTYGLEDGTTKMHTLRGARIFELNERARGVYTDTRVSFAKDFGASMDPKPMRLARPEAFPRYVRG